MKAPLAAALALCALAAQAATTVKVLSLTDDRAELLVNGTALRTLYTGQVSPEGVYLVEIRQGAATVEVDGRRWQMRLGSSTATSVVLQADSRGHFYVDALVNGAPLRALVDTGATSISLPAKDATRMGIEYRRGFPVTTRTASGTVAAWQVRLASVQVGEIRLANIDAIVLETGLDMALLGMSFLNQVEMQRSGTTLTLTRRY